MHLLYFWAISLQSRCLKTHENTDTRMHAHALSQPPQSQTTYARRANHKRTHRRAHVPFTHRRARIVNTTSAYTLIILYTGSEQAVRPCGAPLR